MTLQDYLKLKVKKKTEFAKEVGISRVQLWRYANKKSMPSLATVQKIIEVTNKQVDFSDFCDFLKGEK